MHDLTHAYQNGSYIPPPNDENRKVPTGLVNSGEDLHEAVEREVLEETGVRAKFDCVLLMRQAHGLAFGKSDMFVMCALKPEPGQSVLTPQESEIESASWVTLSEYATQECFRDVPLHVKLSERWGKMEMMDWELPFIIM